MTVLEPDSQDLRRGDIWMADFGAAPSDPEQGYHRPAVIVSDDRLHHPNLNLVVVVPGTTTIRSLPLHVHVGPDSANGLGAPTAFQAEQVRSISTARLLRPLGALDVESRYALEDVLRSVLKL